MVELNLEPPFSVIMLEAETVDWKYGDIALDDVEYTTGECAKVDLKEWSDWSSWSDC